MTAMGQKPQLEQHPAPGPSTPFPPGGSLSRLLFLKNPKKVQAVSSLDSVK